MEELKYSWGFPPDLSTHGAAIDGMINIVHWFMLALFVGWGIFFVYCLVKFRQQPGRKPLTVLPHFKVSKVVEVAVVLFEIFLLIGLALPVWSKVKTEIPPANEALVVKVVAQQFVWNFQYPGKDGLFGRADPTLISDANPLGIDLADPASADDVVTMNQLHFPINRTVIVHLSSKDVIHNFRIPVLRISQDAVPGMTIPVWFQATRTGQFDIACAQLCGVGHTLMRGSVSADTDTDYKAWMAQQPTMSGGAL